MGHKAMIAYEVSSNVYNLHFSPWGADNLKLKEEITQETPFGGDYENPNYVGSFLSNRDDDNADGHLTDANATTKVKPIPKLQNVSIKEAASYFNYLYVEAFFVVNKDMSIESYVPVPCLINNHKDSGVLVKCNSVKEYENIFSKTRTEPWKSVETKSEWKKQVKNDYGSKIAKFSKISI